MNQMFDRKEERATIHEKLKKKHGTLKLFWINGPSGSGKTTLLRHISNYYNENAICFEDGVNIQRCIQEHTEREYEFLSALIKKIYLSSSKNFKDSLVLYNQLPTLPPLWKIVCNATKSTPVIKHLSPLVNGSEVEQAEQVEKQLRALSTPQIIQESVEFLIINYLKKKKENKDFLFVSIDDISWIDDISLKIFLNVLKKCKKEGVRFYIFVTCKISETTSARAKYVYELIEDYLYGSIEKIDLDNLDESKVSEVFNEANKKLPPEIINFIYLDTKGNFEKIGKILNKSEKAICTIYDNNNLKYSKDRENDDHYYRSLRELINNRPQSALFFLTLNEMGNICSLEIMKKIITFIQKKTDIKYTSIKFHNDLNFLIDQNELHQIQGMVICHATRSESAIRIMKLLGFYSSSMYKLASVLLEDTVSVQFNWPNNITRSLWVMSKINAKKTIECHIELKKNSNKDFEYSEVYVPVANAAIELLESDFCSYLKHFISLTIQLSKSNEFRLASAVGDKVMENNSGLVSFDFYFELLKSKRESGSLGDFEAIETLYSYITESARSTIERIKAYTLYCSVLEHQGEFKKIKSIYNEMEEIVSMIDLEQEDNLFTYATYVRNKGLSEFHGDLIDEYLYAYKLTAALPQDSRRCIFLRAALANHAGLGYFYFGQQDKALEYFKKAYNHLKPLALYLETPLNNMACALVMLGEFEEAFNKLEQAESQLYKPIYQTISIKLNKSIVLWKLNETELAYDTASKVLTYDKVPDNLLKTVAHVTLAYFDQLKGDYFKASENLKSASENEYRFLNKEYKKTENALKKFNLVKNGFLCSEDIGDISFIDFEEKKQLPYRRAYRLDPNSLYVD